MKWGSSFVVLPKIDCKIEELKNNHIVINTNVIKCHCYKLINYLKGLTNWKRLLAAIIITRVINQMKWGSRVFIRIFALRNNLYKHVGLSWTVLSSWKKFYHLTKGSGVPLPLGESRFLASLTRMRRDPRLPLELLERRRFDDDDDDDALRNVDTTSTPGGTNLRATMSSPR